MEMHGATVKVKDKNFVFNYNYLDGLRLGRVY
jgi:hypothetical protein